MNISDLVMRLEEIKRERGDIQVYTVRYGCGEYIEVETTVHWKDGESVAVELNLDWDSA